MMMKMFGLVFLVASGVAHAGGTCDTRDSDDRTAVTSRLLAMYTQEQEESASGNPDKAKADADREKEARKLDEKGWLCSPHDQFHAAWVMRFSEDAEVLGRAYELSKGAMNGRVPRSKWLTAYLFDKWHVYLGRPQRYGAMTANHKDKLCLFEVDKLVADDERAQYDMPAIATQYERVMKDHGLKGPFSWDEMQRKGLWCPTLGDSKKKKR